MPWYVGIKSHHFASISFFLHNHTRLLGIIKKINPPVSDIRIFIDIFLFKFFIIGYRVLQLNYIYKKIKHSSSNRRNSLKLSKSPHLVPFFFYRLKKKIPTLYLGKKKTRPSSPTHPTYRCSSAFWSAAWAGWGPWRTSRPGGACAAPASARPPTMTCTWPGAGRPRRPLRRRSPPPGSSRCGRPPRPRPGRATSGKAHTGERSRSSDEWFTSDYVQMGVFFLVRWGLAGRYGADGEPHITSKKLVGGKQWFRCFPSKRISVKKLLGI